MAKRLSVGRVSAIAVKIGARNTIALNQNNSSMMPTGKFSIFYYQPLIQNGICNTILDFKLRRERGSTERSPNVLVERFAILDCKKLTL
jgi:hypothetical protein